jgi:hypothetical protein
LSIDLKLRRRAEKILRRKPDAVLIIGLCGSLSHPLPENRIVA